MRNEILAQLHRNAIAWLGLAINRAPVEVQATLQVGLKKIHEEICSQHILELPGSL